jgi:hypothetical protein
MGLSSPVSVFLSEIDVEYGDVLRNTEVRWLRRVTAWRRFLALRPEVEMLMKEKGKVVAEFSDER